MFTQLIVTCNYCHRTDLTKLSTFDLIESGRLAMFIVGELQNFKVKRQRNSIWFHLNTTIDYFVLSSR
jgi:hypothetical protein